MASRPGKRRIDIRVFPAFESLVKIAWVRNVAEIALVTADPASGAGASVVIADDETLTDLNWRFRGLDEVTDVLSFGEISADPDMLSPVESPVPIFPPTPDDSPTLGEVVLSYPLALRQAGEHNVPAEEELALLIVHGILHLNGHDHANPDEEAAMKALEEAALRLFFADSTSRRMN